MVREAPTLQVVRILAGMGTMLLPKKGEDVTAVCYCRMLFGTHVTAVCNRARIRWQGWARMLLLSMENWFGKVRM